MQAMQLLAQRVHGGDSSFSLVPVSVSMKKLKFEPVLEGSATKHQTRSALIRLWDQEYREHPTHADMLKQALGMHALVLLIDMDDE